MTYVNGKPVLTDLSELEVLVEEQTARQAAIKAAINEATQPTQGTEMNDTTTTPVTEQASPTTPTSEATADQLASAKEAMDAITAGLLEQVGEMTQEVINTAVDGLHKAVKTESEAAAIKAAEVLQAAQEAQIATTQMGEKLAELEADLAKMKEDLAKKPAPKTAPKSDWLHKAGWAAMAAIVVGGGVYAKRRYSASKAVPVVNEYQEPGTLPNMM